VRVLLSRIIFPSIQQVDRVRIHTKSCSLCSARGTVHGCGGIFSGICIYTGCQELASACGSLCFYTQKARLVVEAGVAGAQAPGADGAGGGVVQRGAAQHVVHAAGGDRDVHLRESRVSN